MKIIDVRVAVLGDRPDDPNAFDSLCSPIVRIVTDAGIDGYGQVESSKPYLKPHILYYRDALLGMDPTDVERCMLRIRRRGSFKPWGASVSAIEMALWDVAGKAANLPVHKLLGGKVRDRVRVYNGNVRFPLRDQSPVAYAENMQKMKESPEGFTIIKQGVGYHSAMPGNVPNFSYSYDWSQPDDPSRGGFAGSRGLLTEQGLDHIVRCVEAMKAVTGDAIGLALDCGPGWTIPDAIRLGRAVEPYNIMWIEDILTGDYVPWVNASAYREVTQATTTPVHTGEQIYLRHHFKELFEKQAVRVVGPDPADVGGIAELKWVAEYADLHGILMAPHGTLDGVIGLAALVQVSATLPHNYIAFEYPVARPSWWYDIVDGLPDPIVKDGFIDVWDRPGLGVTFRVDAAKARLHASDRGFFD